MSAACLIAEQLRAQARVLLAQADAIEALHSGSVADDLLDLKAIASEFKIGRDAITGALTRGELRGSQGPRRKLLIARSELRRWLAAKPYTPAPPAANDSDADDWDQQCDRALGLAR